MFATLFALLVATLLLLFPSHTPTIITTNPSIFTVIPLLLLLVQGGIWALAFLPFQKAEQHLTPRVLELSRHDWHFKLYAAGLTSTAFLGIWASMNPYGLDNISPTAWLAAWIVFIGLGFDFLYLGIKRIYDFLNPFRVVTLFTTAAKNSVTNDRELDLCNWVESLSEIGVKSLNRSSSSLCIHTLNEMREVLRIFLDSSKSIAHETQDQQSQSVGITDKVSYTLFYFLDRVSLIYHKALDQKIEPVCSAIVTTLGKIIVDAGRCDLSLVNYPVRYLGEFCHKASQNQMNDIPLKGSCTFVEASRAIVEQVDLTYQDLVDPFASIINELDETAKNTFRQDKNSNIKILTQPLLDLKNVFQSDKVASHRDTPAVMSMIDRKIAEWDTLQTVLRTMPAMPVIKDEGESMKDASTEDTQR